MLIFWAITAGCCNALSGLFTKQVEQTQCRPAQFSLLFMGTITVVSAAVFSVVGGAWGSPWLGLVAVAMGALYPVTVRASIPANRCFPPSLVWMLVNIALVVPIGLAPLLLRERWRAMDGVTVGTFAVLLYACQRGTRQAGDAAPARWREGLSALTAVFLVNGLLMFGYKLKGAVWPDAGAAPFALLVFGSGFLAELLLRLRRRDGLDIRAAEWKWCLAVGVATAGASLSLLGAVRLPAVVVFPVVQGISLGVGILLMLLVYREGLNAWKLAGFALAGCVVLAACLR